MELKLTAWGGKQSPLRGSSCSRTVARCQLWCSSSLEGRADDAVCGRTLVSMPEEAMLGGALEAQASHQLRGTGWWDVAIEIRAKGHAVAAGSCLNLSGLMSSTVPGVVEGEGASMDHLAPVVRVHGVLVLVLLAGRGFEAARVESWPSARWN